MEVDRLEAEKKQLQAEKDQLHFSRPHCWRRRKAFKRSRKVIPPPSLLCG
jgi:hypothetical protein